MFDEQVLVQAGCSAGVVAHSLAVSRLALSIADAVTIPVDRDLVRQGGLLHDIGRCRTHGLDHAVAGVTIARSLGAPERLLDVIERHIGAGIPLCEAGRLGLPEKDYMPLTPEEKIVSYADNLIDGVTETDFTAALEKFKDMLGPDHEGVELFIRQHNEIRGWMREGRR